MHKRNENVIKKIREKLVQNPVTEEMIIKL